MGLGGEANALRKEMEKTKLNDREKGMCAVILCGLIVAGIIIFALANAESKADDSRLEEVKYEDGVTYYEEVVE